MNIFQSTLKTITCTISFILCNSLDPVSQHLRSGRNAFPCYHQFSSCFTARRCKIMRQIAIDPAQAQGHACLFQSCVYWGLANSTASVTPWCKPKATSRLQVLEMENKYLPPPLRWPLMLSEIGSTVSKSWWWSETYINVWKKDK